MLDELKEQQVDKWLADYKPVANHLSETSGWEINEKGILFETYGDELDFVRQQPDNHVWTWIDGDEGTVIVAGMAFVNRIGYFVTEVAWTDESAFVEVDTYNEEEGDE
jgi:predicted methyltransferase MtxX (methanogen marker protein 4)